MTHFGPDEPSRTADEPAEGDDGAQPLAPAAPQRVAISTSPPWAGATGMVGSTPGSPPAPGQVTQQLPYGASSSAPYTVGASPRGGRVKRLLLPLLVLALVGGGLAFVFRDRLVTHDDGPSHPTEWDPRVADLAEVVSTERGLDWVHPVYVDFLTDADFVALFDAPVVPVSTPVDTTAALYSQLYDAFGLAVGYDPTEGEAAVSAATTLGFYSPDSDRISVRGDQLGPAERVVLVHELTHALQAQHFELATGGPNDLELRSVVEADAMRVEGVYRATLTAADRAAADDGTELGAEAEQALAEVPWAVLEQRNAPYVLGPTLVDQVFAADGNGGVNQLIRTPPTEEVLLNPWLYGTDQRAAPVTVTVPDGATVLDAPQPLSELDMLIMLDAWLPWRQTRTALDGWGGGGFTSYEQDGNVCFTASANFEQSGDLFANAITDWAAAAGSDASPAVIVNDVTFEACDRGPGAAVPPTPVVSPLQALSFEHDAIALAGPNPSAEDIEDYQCFAATMIDDELLAPLLFTERLTADQQAVFLWQSTIAANSCGVPAVTP
jgi:hypothetical protein